MLYDHRTRRFGAVRSWKGQDGKTYRDTHKGDDYAETYGNDPIPAIQPGKVINNAYSTTYGNLLWVRRDQHVVVKYHMLEERSRFANGSQVKPGDHVGLTGASAANASGNHAHIQVEVNGIPVDPEPYIRGAVAGIGGSSPFNNTPAKTPDESEDMFKRMVSDDLGQSWLITEVGAKHIASPQLDGLIARLEKMLEPGAKQERFNTVELLMVADFLAWMGAEAVERAQRNDVAPTFPVPDAAPIVAAIKLALKDVKIEGLDYERLGNTIVDIQHNRLAE